MARPQMFDQDVVLDSAMRLFWRKGYANTSIKDLTEATELQPGSLYAAFNNKRNLFIKSLDYYFVNLLQSVNSVLHSEDAPFMRIRRFYDLLLNQVKLDNEHKSCLLVNTLLEIPPDDEEINHRVSEMFRQIEQEFRSVLQEAQLKGVLAVGATPDSIAKVLMNGIFGLQVYNRMQTDEESLRQIVNNLLDMLES